MVEIGFICFKSKHDSSKFNSEKMVIFHKHKHVIGTWLANQLLGDNESIKLDKSSKRNGSHAIPAVTIWSQFHAAKRNAESAAVRAPADALEAALSHTRPKSIFLDQWPGYPEKRPRQTKKKKQFCKMKLKSICPRMTCENES
jgi:hypothetical protein